MECVTTECMETQRATEMDCGITSRQIVGLSKVHVKELELKERNQRDLKALQEVISMEEDRVPNAEEVLCRVLSFYNKFVPFKDNA